MTTKFALKEYIQLNEVEEQISIEFGSDAAVCLLTISIH